MKSLFLQTFAFDFDDYITGSVAALDYDCELSAEKMHLRQVERLEAGRVSVAYRLEGACSGYLHLDKPAVSRNRIPVLVGKAYIDKTQS